MKKIGRWERSSINVNGERSSSASTNSTQTLNV